MPLAARVEPARACNASGTLHSYGGLKYRLYEIDRLISRTVAYAIVTGLLAGVYAGPVLLATRVMPLRGSAAVAGSTLAAAAVFSPLRRRVQRVVDRRFNQTRYGAELMITAFAARLQDATDLDAVRADLISTVHGTLEPMHMSLWLGRAERLSPTHVGLGGLLAAGVDAGGAVMGRRVQLVVPRRLLTRGSKPLQPARCRSDDPVPPDHATAPVTASFNQKTLIRPLS